MKKFFVIVLTLVMTLSSTAFADGVWYSPEEQKSLDTAGEIFPTLSAESYVVMDSRTGEVLFSEKENVKMPIASTTKMMTALVVVENVENLDTTVTVDAESCGIEGSSVNLFKGEKITVRDLLYALMLESANDAAVCLARAVSGSVEAFAELMNSKAQALGMTNSHFINPHGLEHEQHYSTSLDLAKLWQYSMKVSVLREIVATKTYKIEMDTENSYRFLSNHNKLLKTYEPCVGGKTGFTKAAGRCLVSVSRKDDVELIVVTLNDPADWEDHKNLSEYSFSLYSKVLLAEAGQLSVPISVVGGDKSETRLSNRERLEVSVRDVGKITSVVEAPHFLYAPVVTGDENLGRVVFYYNGTILATLDLFSLDEVELKEKDMGFFEKIWSFFFG